MRRIVENKVDSEAKLISYPLRFSASVVFSLVLWVYEVAKRAIWAL